MRRVMFIGQIGAGKTSLINALKGKSEIAEKTQAISFEDGMIDTPGEYAQIPRFYSTLLVTAMEAAVIAIVQDATQNMVVIPPGFAGMFPRDVIGVITKIDLAEADRDTALKRLQEAGVTGPVFYISSVTGQGLEELYTHLSRKEV